MLQIAGSARLGEHKLECLRYAVSYLQQAGEVSAGGRQGKQQVGSLHRLMLQAAYMCEGDLVKISVVELVSLAAKELQSSVSSEFRFSFSSCRALKTIISCCNSRDEKERDLTSGPNVV